MNNRNTLFLKLGLFASALAFVVVVLGAFVRLSHAGLGCPDWPGCYGHLDVPQSQTEIAQANQVYPERPVETAKAWKEMIHRYFAGALGLLVFAMAIVAVRNRTDSQQQLKLPLFLVGLIIFQALLGMWTVTIKLNPTIVMSHLMGGLATLSLLWWVSLREGKLLNAFQVVTDEQKALQKYVLIGLLIVILQLMLGGWTSANYAALHCTDFPTCRGQWIPELNMAEAFTLWRGTELNFEGGVLSDSAGVTVHFMHRVGALLTFLYIGWLAMNFILAGKYKFLRPVGMVLLGVLCLQVMLGISNVLFSLPLWVAVAHNGVGALLLLAMVTLNHIVRSKE